MLSGINLLAMILAALAGYLLGSISFSIVYSRLFRHEDIRRYGSGNAGMTNVLRTYGKRAAAFVLLGDLLKGMAAVVVARWIFALLGVGFMDGGYVGGALAILGHLFPLYFGFKGGKGVLTTVGVVLMLNPLVVALLVVPVLAIIFITRYVSVGSITAAVLYPLTTVAIDLVDGNSVFFDAVFSVVIALIIIYMHRANIRRLLNGTENRFGRKKEC